MGTCGVGNGGITTPPTLGGPPGATSVLSARGEYGGIRLFWTLPLENPASIAFTRVFRSTTSSNSNAVELATAGGNTYWDDSADEPIRTYWYWIKYVSIYGTESVFIGGVSATAIAFVSQLIDLLAGRIENGLLAPNLRSRIDKITEIENGLTNTNDLIAGQNDVFSRELLALRQADTQTWGYIFNERSIRLTEQSAIVSQTNTLVAQTRDDLNSAIQQQFAVFAGPDGLGGEYFVKIDLGGYVTGFGLAAAVDPEGNTQSEFGVLADTFFVAAPTTVSNTAPMVTWNGRVWRDTSVNPNVIRWYSTQAGAWVTTPVRSAYPFIVKSAPEVIDGVTIQPGVYMDSAYISRLTADKIDSRGLTIRDTAGNLILSSGNNPVNVSPTFNAIQRWDFDAASSADGTVDGWTGTFISAVVNTTSIEVTSTGTDPTVLSPVGLGISGDIYNKVQVRIKRNLGSSWDGTLFYSTFGTVTLSKPTATSIPKNTVVVINGSSRTVAANVIAGSRLLPLTDVSGISASAAITTPAYFEAGTLAISTTASHGMVSGFRKQIPFSGSNGNWLTFEWDMSSLTEGGTNWASSVIDQIRLDFSSAAGDKIEIDYIAIGRYSSGGLDKITNDNISTFIADLAVNSLQIKNFAVTNPYFDTYNNEVIPVTWNPGVNNLSLTVLATRTVTIAPSDAGSIGVFINIMVGSQYINYGGVSTPAIGLSVQIDGGAEQALAFVSNSFAAGYSGHLATAASMNNVFGSTLVFRLRGGHADSPNANNAFQERYLSIMVVKK